jgi:WD40 repeat protein
MASVLLLLSTIAALGIGQWRATSALHQTESALHVAEHNLYFRSITSAQERWRANDPQAADAMLDECPPEMRDFEWGYLKHLVRTPARRLNAGGVLCYHPEGKELATAGGSIIPIKVWDARADVRLQTLIGHEDYAQTLDYHSDGNLLVSAGRNDKTVRIWDASKGREIRVLRGFERPVEKCAFTPDGSQIVSWDKGNYVRVWDVTSGEQAGAMHIDRKRVRDVMFSPASPHLAVASGRGPTSEVFIYDYTTKTRITGIPVFESTVGSLAYSDDGSRVAVGEVCGAIRVWQVEPTLNLLATIAGPVSQKCRVAFDAAGDRVAAEALDGTIRVWGITRGETLLTLRGHSRPVYDIAFSPDGRSLAAGSGGNEVCIWDATTEQGSIAYSGGSRTVHDLAVSPGGEMLAAGLGDGTASVWRRVTGELLQTFPGNGETVWSVAFSPDGRRIAVACEDKSVKVYELASGELKLHFKEHIRPLRCVVFSPNGELAASAGLDNSILVWDAWTGEVQQSFRMRGPSIRRLAFHPDSRRLAGGGAGPDVSVFDVFSGEELWTETGDKPSRVWDVAFSPDGDLLAIGRGDGRIRLRKSEDGKLVNRFGDLAKNLPVALSFSPNGRRLASATARTAVSLWETASGRNILNISRDSSTFGAIAFLPDGEAVITGDVHGTVRLWPTIDYHTKLVGNHSGPGSRR